MENKEKWRRRFRKRVRNKILKRDDHKCRICGAKKELTVHHIYSISACLKQGNYNLIKDKNNLVTLCEQCHIKAPNGNGYYNWEAKKRKTTTIFRSKNKS